MENDLTSTRIDSDRLFVVGYKDTKGSFFLYEIRNTVFYLNKGEAEIAKETAIRANWAPPNVIGVYSVSIPM